MKSILAAATALFSLSMLAAPANAEALKTGFLVCQVEEGSGFVFGSTKTVACLLVSSTSPQVEPAILPMLRSSHLLLNAKSR